MDGDTQGSASGRGRSSQVIRLLGGSVSLALIAFAALGLVDVSAGGFQAAGAGTATKTCESFIAVMRTASIALGVLAVIFAALSVSHRERAELRILRSVWGPLAMGAFLLALGAFGAWRFLAANCAESRPCADARAEQYATSFVLGGITLVVLAIGIALSHARRVPFLSTAWGLLALALFLPTMLSLLHALFLGTLCGNDVSCDGYQRLSDGLGTMFWAGASVALVGFTVGRLVAKRTGRGGLVTGWGVLAGLGLAVSVAGGLGLWSVGNLSLASCAPPLNAEYERGACERVQDHFQRGLGWATFVLVLAGAAAAGAWWFLGRDRRGRRRWGGLMVPAVALLAAILLGIAGVFVGILCRQGSGDDGDSTSEGRVTVVRGSAAFSLVFLHPALLWFLGVGAALVPAWVLVRIVQRRRERPKETATTAPATPAEDLEGLLRALRSVPMTDAQAVVTAYRAFLVWAARRGVPKEPSETPLEHAQRLLARVPLPAAPVEALVRAYDVTRYSTNAPRSEDAQNALRIRSSIEEKKP